MAGVQTASGRSAWRWTVSACGVWAGLALATAPIQRAIASDRQTPIVKAIQAAAPAVINLHGQKTVRTAATPTDAGPFKQVNGMGTGVIVDPRGYAITNYHVVEDVREIRATLADGRSTTARVIGFDAVHDLAVIRLQLDQPAAAIDLGTSSDLMLGEQVIAIGNPFGYEHTVTTGIISQLHRHVQVNDTQEYRDLIQTNTEINPGNSGGPLINIDGQMIGVVVAVRVGAQGIAFAIPIDEVLQTAADLIERSLPTTSSLGVDVADQWQTETGWRLVVSDRVEQAAATPRELAPGDRITAADGLPIHTRLDLALALLGHRSEEQLHLDIDRDGAGLSLALDLHSPLHHTLVNPAWELVGLEVAPIAPAILQKLNTKYEGGLTVTRVRTGSPAARNGLREGDVLVGIHRWATTTPEDLEYILQTPELQTAAPADFYIVRAGQTLVGRLEFNQTPKR
jgi:serine protease Do